MIITYEISNFRVTFHCNQYRGLVDCAYEDSSVDVVQQEGIISACSAFSMQESKLMFDQLESLLVEYIVCISGKGHPTRSYTRVRN